MPEHEKKIIVDDDWKAQARQEKERLAQETAQVQALPDPSFAELVNIVVMQALAGLGLLPGPGGERIPPNLELAKHYIDMLQVLEDKTRNNLTDQERRMLDQVLYETRMSYVQLASAAGVAPGTAPSVKPPGPAPA